MPPVLYCTIAALCLVAACTRFPELDARTGDLSQLPYPDLVPTAPLVAGSTVPADAEAAAAPLRARAEALERRAQALDGPVVDAETLRRLRAARAAAE